MIGWRNSSERAFVCVCMCVNKIMTLITNQTCRNVQPIILVIYLITFIYLLLQLESGSIIVYFIVEVPLGNEFDAVHRRATVGSTIARLMC